MSNFDFPITLLAATARDQYRKPRTGMWNELLEELDLEVGTGPDLSTSFFVGDAGGRPARKNFKADHSCSDRDLANNVGIDFKTPEEFFLLEQSVPYVRQFEPGDYVKAVLEDEPNASESIVRWARVDLALRRTSSKPDDKDEQSRYHCLLWQPSCRQINFLLDLSTTSRVRACESGHTQNSMPSTSSRSFTTMTDNIARGTNVWKQLRGSSRKGDQWPLASHIVDIEPLRLTA